MNKKKVEKYGSLITILLVVIIVSSMFIQNLPDIPTSKEQTTPEEVKGFIPIDIIIEERTGDGFYDSLIESEPGWYVMTYKGDWKKTTFTKDQIGRTYVLLVTKDQKPNLHISSSEGYFSMRPAIIILSSVPRGYPDGGTRIYKITMDYPQLKNTVFFIHNDYYDTNSERFAVYPKEDVIK